MFDALTNYIKDKYKNEASGHDWFHIERVIHLARKINQDSALDREVYLTALLHEELDDKLNDVLDAEGFVNLLETHRVSASDFPNLYDHIQSLGFKGGFTKLTRHPVAQAVYEADLLEAIGAIGIARTFQYNGEKKKAPFYDPDLAKVQITSYEDYRNAKRNAIAHFDEKLLRLLPHFVTPLGKELAQKRHKRMVTFVQDFFEELAEAGVDISDRFDL